MAGTVELIYKISADSSQSQAEIKKLLSGISKDAGGISNALGGAGAAFAGFGNSVGSILSSAGSAISSFGTTLTAAVTLPIAALAALGVRFNATKEQALTSFGVMLKSGEKAKTLYAELQKFAASTPFEMPEIASSAKSLLAFGVAQEKILPTLRQIGDIASGVGIPLNELAQIYGKAKTQGRLFAEDINQLTGRGIPIIQELAKQFKVSDSEIKNLVESGKIGFPQLEQAFANLTGAGGQFAGMMEEQSKTFSGRLSTLWDTINTLAGSLFEPLFAAISAAMPYIIQVLEYVSGLFTALGPTAKIVITAIIAIVSAVGPLLVVLGGVLAAVGSIVTGVVALGGLVVVAKFVGIAILAVIGIFIQFIPIILGVAAAAAGLYLAWKTNFGGIQTYTIAAWTAIKFYIGEAMEFIYGTVVKIGGAVVGWWRENYPAIKETVIIVSESIKSYIQGFLSAINSFWTKHGAGIIDYIKTYWGIVKDLFSSAMAQIGNFIKLAMSLIKGDWEGAWVNFQSILTNAVKTLTQIWSGFLTLFWKALKAVIPIIIEMGAKIVDTLSLWIGKAVIGAVYILATLPEQILKLIPKLVSAGQNIGAAIWQGIREGLSGNTASIPVNTPTYTNTQNPVDSSIVSATAIADANQPGQTTTNTNAAADADKRRKEREEAFKKQLAAESERNQILLQQERDNFAASQKLWDDAFSEKKVTAENYRTESLANIAKYQEAVTAFLKKQAEFDSKGKTGTELENISLKLKSSLTALEREVAAEKADLEKAVTETKKVESEKRTAITVQELKSEVALRESSMATVNARNERDVATGIITQKKADTAKRQMEADYFDLKLKNLELEKTAYAKGSDDEKRITEEIFLFKQEIERKGYEAGKAAVENHKKDLEEIAAIRRQITETERGILEFRAEQTRKSLTNTVDNSSGKARIEALKQLRDFELAEEARKEVIRLADLEKEKSDALKRVEGKETEEAQKKAIEDLYREKALLSEIEFQIKLKEIKDGFNLQIEDAKSDAGNGFGGGFLGGLNGEQLGKFDAGISFMKNALNSLGNVAGQVFGAMAKGVGTMVESWVLLGNAGGASLRKFAAQVLSSVASQAVVLAIFELAKGFAALFLNPAEAAAHFTAAALFGSIGGIAAIAGRAIAGNSFSQANAQSGNNQNQINSQQNQQNQAQNQQNVENALRIIAEDRANPSRNELIVRVQSNDSHIVDVVNRDVGNNGDLRSMFVKIAEAV